MFRLFGLSFFLVRLGLTIAPTTFSLGWASVSTYKPLLVALVMLLSTLFVSTIHLISAKIATPPPNPLIGAQQFFESLSDKQPTHRDVLINLSRIYQSIGNEEKAQQYRDKAQKLDPNNPLFTQEK